MARRARFGLAAVLALAGAAPAAPPGVKPPKDAPFCAAPGTRQVFVAPMGEAYRAPAGTPYPAAHWFAAVDRNADGTVDRAEVVADADRFFRTLDRNGDGRLTPEEVIGYEQDVAPEIALYGGRRAPDLDARARNRRLSAAGLADDLGLGSGRGESANYFGPLGAGRYAWLNIPEPVASADTDIDRVVSAAEFSAAAGRRFDALDKAGAGRLRLADLPRTPQQIAIEGPCRPRPKPRPEEHRGPFDDPSPDAPAGPAPR